MTGVYSKADHLEPAKRLELGHNALNFSRFSQNPGTHNLTDYAITRVSVGIATGIIAVEAFGIDMDTEA